MQYTSEHANGGDRSSRHDRGAWALVTTDPDIPNAHLTSAKWLDPRGVDSGRAVYVADDYMVDLTWLPSRRKVEADVSCDVDLLDLPPPTSPPASPSTK